MKAIIIAGGRGERLRPVTDRVPKPMIEVADKPVLEHVIKHLKQHGITQFIFTLCYLSEIITDYFGTGRKFGASIDYVFENQQKPLGTAGSIKSAEKLIQEDFIVTYADILRKLNVTSMIDAHRKKRAFASLHVYKRLRHDAKSIVVFNRTGRILRFIERPENTIVNEESIWANGSFYIFNKEVFDYIPKNKSTDFGKDIIPRLLKDKRKIFAYPSNDYFVDIGNLKKLERARRTFKGS